MAKNSKTNYYYDKEADVFYISNEMPQKKELSNEVDDGVIARFNPKTKKVNGLTILNFAKRTQKKSQSINLPFNIAFAV